LTGLGYTGPIPILAPLGWYGVNKQYNLMANLAVIKTGGKQYIVTPGKKLKIEKLALKEGSDVVFEEILLLENDKGVEVGAPLVQGAKVKAKLLKQGKGKKVIIFKFKAKKRESTKTGHRQPYSEVEITSIELK